MPCFQSSIDGIMSTDMKNLGLAKFLLRRNYSSGSRASSISLRSSEILCLHRALCLKVGEIQELGVNDYLTTVVEF